ncbi:MAG: cell envelope integrity protein TolA [Hyphomonadaceae bacterium]|nr:cell envelope integrity protein TolA [Hyphomonadaceae bacterium]
MQFGLVISVILHAAILGWALITIQAQRELGMAEPEPIITELISESELTKLKKGVRSAKQLEAMAKETPKADIAKKETAKPKPVPAAPAPPPPEPPAPKTDPIAEKLAAAQPPPVEEKKKIEEQLKTEQLKAEQRKADEQRRAAEEQLALEGLRKAEEQRKAEEERKAEEQRKADEQRRAEEQRQAEEKKRQDEEQQRKLAEQKKKADEEKKRKEAALKKKREEEKKRKDAEARQKQFDAEKIAALLNKVPNSAAPTPSSEPTENTKAKGPALGAPEGRDKQISASESAMLKGRISSRLKGCWRLPSGGGGSDTPVVTLRWRLKLDGSLDGDPQVEQPRGDALFRIAAEAAMRAVRECSPFDLPPEKYSSWKTITWDFDPSQMM